MYQIIKIFNQEMGTADLWNVQKDTLKFVKTSRTLVIVDTNKNVPTSMFSK